MALFDISIEEINESMRGNMKAIDIALENMEHEDEYRDIQKEITEMNDVLTVSTEAIQKGEILISELRTNSDKIKTPTDLILAIENIDSHIRTLGLQPEQTFSLENVNSVELELSLALEEKENIFKRAWKKLVEMWKKFISKLKKLFKIEEREDEKITEDLQDVIKEMGQPSLNNKTEPTATNDGKVDIINDKVNEVFYLSEKQQILLSRLVRGYVYSREIETFTTSTLLDIFDSKTSNDINVVKQISDVIKIYIDRDTELNEEEIKEYNKRINDIVISEKNNSNYVNEKLYKMFKTDITLDFTIGATQNFLLIGGKQFKKGRHIKDVDYERFPYYGNFQGGITFKNLRLNPGKLNFQIQMERKYFLGTLKVIASFKLPNENVKLLNQISTDLLNKKGTEFNKDVLGNVKELISTIMIYNKDIRKIRRYFSNKKLYVK